MQYIPEPSEQTKAKLENHLKSYLFSLMMASMLITQTFFLTLDLLCRSAYLFPYLVLDNAQNDCIGRKLITTLLYIDLGLGF